MAAAASTRVTREVVARAPTRIDLGGGWTDVPPYCEREGGFVCNVAITKYASAIVRAKRDAAHVSTHDESRVRTNDASSVTSTPLVAAALRRKQVIDAHVAIANDFPFGAGLGGSSAASAAVLGALSEWRGDQWTPAGIAEEGRRIEVEELGVAGGRQDHYAATHGGALALTFTTGVAVRRIPMSAKTRADLPSRATLIYTGESRISGDTITAVLGAYEVGESHVLLALRRMRDLALAMSQALERGDLDAVGEVLGEHWTHQRSLHPSIPTPRIDEIVTRSLQVGALGAKAMGASGGGCVLVLARASNAERVREAMRAFGDVIEFDVDESGLTIVKGRA